MKKDKTIDTKNELLVVFRRNIWRNIGMEQMTFGIPLSVTENMFVDGGEYKCIVVDQPLPKSY